MKSKFISSQKDFSSAVVDPYAANVVLFLKGNGINGSISIIDSSPSARIISVFGNTQLSAAESKYGGSSILFDGAGDYITTSALGLFSVDFTVEYWMYKLTSKFGVVLSSYTIPNQSGAFLNFTHSNGAVTAYNGGSGDVNTPSIANNIWNHVAVTYQHSTGQIKIYLNGVLSQANTSFITTQNSTLWIGGAPNDPNIGAWFLHSYIDSLRVTSTVIRYTANFNPETDTYLNG